MSARESRAGVPQFYALSGRKLFLDCPVVGGAEFEIIFKQGVPDDLDGAIADPPVTLTRESQMVIADACRHIGLTRLKNREEASRHEEAYQFRLQTLLDEEDLARGDLIGGGIMPDNSYHAATVGARYAR